METAIDNYITLPRQPREMVTFLQAQITKAVQDGVDDIKIVQLFHDYTCTWLMATVGDDLEEPLPIATDKRYN